MPSAIIKLTWAPNPSTNPISLFPRKLLVPSNTTHSTIFHTAPSTPRRLTVKSSAGTAGEGGSLRNALTSIVGEQVEELLKRDENKDLLDGLEKASLRVEMAQRELAEIEKQELEAKLARDYIAQLETRASEIAECQEEILEAKSKVEEAERVLSQGEDQIGDGYAFSNAESVEVNKDEERWQSIKVASVSALVGTVAGLPFSLTQASTSCELIAPLAITFVSCALFGVTFRYAIRRDLDDVHLKTGAPAAFGVVKGLATLDGGKPLQLNIDSFLSHAFDGAVYVSQSLFIFLSAAVALDYCFKTSLLSPFPVKKSVSQSNSR